MIDLESSMTFEQMILDLAERSGNAYYGANGDEALQLPADERTLQTLSDWINRGYRWFLQQDPHWTFCQTSVPFTCSPEGTGPYNVAADAGRMKLPHPLRSRPKSNPRFTSTTTRTTGIAVYTPEAVLALRQQDPTTGTPLFCAFRPIPQADRKPGEHPNTWEMLLWPSPDSAYTLEADFRIVPYPMIEPSERHVAGADHDTTILAAAAYEWASRDSTDPSQKASLLAERTAAIAASIRLDRSKRPPRLGKLRDPSSERLRMRTPGDRGGGLVTTMDGNPIP